MSSADQIFKNFQIMNRDWAQACMMWGQSYFNLVDSLIKFWSISSSFYTFSPSTGGFK